MYVQFDINIGFMIDIHIMLVFENFDNDGSNLIIPGDKR